MFIIIKWWSQTPQHKQIANCVDYETKEAAEAAIVQLQREFPGRCFKVVVKPCPADPIGGVDLAEEKCRIHT